MEFSKHNWATISTHLKGSWLFSCLGLLKTRKFIKYILSSVKKDAPKGIFTYFKAFFFCISTDFRKTAWKVLLY